MEGNVMGFEATVDYDALRIALRALKATVIKQSVRSGDKGVLVHSDGDRLTLSTAVGMNTTHTTIPATLAGAGETLIDIRDLKTAVQASSGGRSISLHAVPARHYDPREFLRRTERPSHVATADADHFRFELEAILHTAGDPKDTLFGGVRLWFTEAGIYLQGRDLNRMTVALVPATVAPEAVGRSVLLPVDYLTAVRLSLTGPQVELGLTLDDPTPLVSLTTESTLLVVQSWPGTPIGWAEALSDTSAWQASINRLSALGALTKAANRAAWGRELSERSVVVHVDEQPVRITHEGEDDDSCGRVMVFDAALLKLALQTFIGQEVTLHAVHATPTTHVIMTEQGVTLGDLTALHHVIRQEIDPRLSQQRRRFRAFRQDEAGHRQCRLRPRSLGGLDETLSLRPWHANDAYGSCVRADRKCSRCPVMERFHTPWEPPFNGDKFLMRGAPTIGPRPLHERLRLMPTPEADWADGIQITWEELAAATNWKPGKTYKDDISHGFWLVRVPEQDG